MKIIYLRLYTNGYRGFLEEKECYVFFQFPRGGQLKRLVKYEKSLFSDYRHFVGGISKFMPRLYFLEEPVLIQSVTIEELDRVFENAYK